jgi:hypothetical protein
LRGLGVFLQFRTPSISKKMTFIFFLTFLRSHSPGGSPRPEILAAGERM